MILRSIDWIVPIVVMVAIAVIQRWRLRHRRQSVWKGGGFGMFADIPRHSISVTIEALLHSSTPSRLAAEPSPLESRVAIMPTRSNLHRWAVQLFSAGWASCAGGAVRVAAGDGLTPIRVGAVEVTLLRMDFDGTTGTYRSTRLRP
jgi:hypothetical protein